VRIGLNTQPFKHPAGPCMTGRRSVGERGGRGIPVRVDVTDDPAVANAFDGNALPFAGGPFWTLPWEHWQNMIDAGVRGHALSSWHSRAWPCSRVTANPRMLSSPATCSTTWP
jgi:hypothetical protein